MKQFSYPIGIYEDRYLGTYSHGAWIAVANADERDFLNSNAYGSDPEADEYWSHPPDWLAVGATPQIPLSKLRLKFPKEDYL